MFFVKLNKINRNLAVAISSVYIYYTRAFEVRQIVEIHEFCPIQLTFKRFGVIFIAKKFNE